jgi:hypothetical protein
MKLHEEIYFEINVEGAKSELDRFVSYLSSGILDDFFEFSDDYIIYDDDYDYATESQKVTLVFTNDEYAIEASSFDPEEFLDALCRGARNVYLSGHIFDVDDDEYRFASDAGDASFYNTDNISLFNDELDAQAYEEELAAEEDSEE